MFSLTKAGQVDAGQWSSSTCSYSERECWWGSRHHLWLHLQFLFLWSSIEHDEYRHMQVCLLESRTQSIKWGQWRSEISSIRFLFLVLVQERNNKTLVSKGIQQIPPKLLKTFFINNYSERLVGINNLPIMFIFQLSWKMFFLQDANSWSKPEEITQATKYICTKDL